MAVKAVSVRRVTAAGAGPVTRAAQDVAGAAEALTVGALHLTRSTLAAAVETVEDVGGRLGSLAVSTVRGAAKAATDIGGDVGTLSARAVNATIDATRELGGEVGSLAVEAMEGTVVAVDRIGSAAGRSLRDALSGTVAGVRTVFSEAGVSGAGPRRLPARAPAAVRRPLGRARRPKRSAPEPKAAETA